MHIATCASAGMGADRLNLSLLPSRGTVLRGLWKALPSALAHCRMSSQIGSPPVQLTPPLTPAAWACIQEQAARSPILSQALLSGEALLLHQVVEEQKLRAAF